MARQKKERYLPLAEDMHAWQSVRVGWADVVALRVELLAAGVEIPFLLDMHILCSHGDRDSVPDYRDHEHEGVRRLWALARAHCTATWDH